MAERLVRSGAQVERILSSTALRARTTAAQFGEALDVEVEQRRSLYLASDDELFEQAAASGASSVMIVAHDPGLTELAFRLSGGGIPHMPTCAAARFAWDANSWSDVGDRSPDRWSFDSPRGGSVNT